MSLRVICPTCRQALSVASEHTGRAVGCPHCQQNFVVRSSAPLTMAMPGRVPPPKPPLPIRRLQIGAATASGRRERNEDCYLCLRQRWSKGRENHEAALLMVADGMGGHAAGDRAGALAIAAMAKALAPNLASMVADESPNTETLLEWLDLGLWEAHRAILQEGELPGQSGMGATAVVALIRNGHVAISHIGDCRAYFYQPGVWKCLTRDQTMAMRMVEMGKMTEQEARRHPLSSQVTQALGRRGDMEPSRQGLILQAGDRLILACDGLHADLPEGKLAEIVGREKGSQQTAEKLIQEAAKAGGSDNCTVIVIQGSDKEDRE